MRDAFEVSFFGLGSSNDNHTKTLAFCRRIIWIACTRSHLSVRNASLYLDREKREPNTVERDPKLTEMIAKKQVEPLDTFNCNANILQFS